MTLLPPFCILLGCLLCLINAIKARKHLRLTCLIVSGLGIISIIANFALKATGSLIHSLTNALSTPHSALQFEALIFLFALSFVEQLKPQPHTLEGEVSPLTSKRVQTRAFPLPPSAGDSPRNAPVRSIVRISTQLKKRFLFVAYALKPAVISTIIIIAYNLSLLGASVMIDSHSTSDISQFLPFPLQHPASFWHILNSIFGKIFSLLGGLLLILSTAHEGDKIDRARSVLRIAFLSQISCLFLGMFWASDSPNWGRLWGWDAIETLSLATTCVCYAALFHVQKSKKLSNIEVKLSIVIGLILCFCVLLQHFLIRSSLLWGIHAYGQSDVPLSYWIFSFGGTGLLLCVFAIIRFVKIKKSEKRSVQGHEILEFMQLLSLILCIFYALFLYSILILERSFGLYFSFLLPPLGLVLLLFLGITRLSSCLILKEKRGICIFQLLCAFFVLFFLSLSLSSEEDSTYHLKLASTANTETLVFEGISVESNDSPLALSARLRVKNETFGLKFFMAGGHFLWGESRVIRGLREDLRLRIRSYDAIEGIVVDVRKEKWRSPLLLFIVLYFLSYLEFCFLNLKIFGVLSRKRK